MTKIAQLAHLQAKIPDKSSSFYRRILGLNSKTYRGACEKLRQWHVSAAMAEMPDCRSSLVVYGD